MSDRSEGTPVGAFKDTTGVAYERANSCDNPAMFAQRLQEKTQQQSPMRLPMGTISEEETLEKQQ